MKSTLIQLNKSRLEDLKLLVKIRNAKKYKWPQDEIRNVLFIYAVSLSHLELSSAISEFIEFNSLLNCKSINFYKSIITRLPSFHKHFQKIGTCRYKFSNDRIIEMINISDDELINMNCIVSTEQKAKREERAIAEELERIRIENEIDKSIAAYEFNKNFVYHDEVIEIDYDADGGLDNA